MIRVKNNAYLWAFYGICVAAAAYLVATRAITVREVGIFLASAALVPSLVEARKKRATDERPMIHVEHVEGGSARAGSSASKEAEGRAETPPP